MGEKTLVEALAKAQSEMDSPVKDKKNPQFDSLYASLGSIITAVKPALNNNGIAYVQHSVPVEGGISVETVFYGMGETIETGPVTIPAAKVTPQGFGSAMTYAKRYSLAMACGVDADEDDDGNAAEQEVPKNAKAPAAKAKKTAKTDVVPTSEDFFKKNTDVLIDELASVETTEEAKAVMGQHFPSLKKEYEGHPDWNAFANKIKGRLAQLATKPTTEEEDLPF